MKRLLTIAGTCALLAIFATPGNASVIFTFTEAGGTVTMTSSGTLDTTKLVASVLTGGWGGVGTENNATPGDIDIMGGNTVGGGITAKFGFNPGTDDSDITNPGGPFAFSSFGGITVAGTRAFATYSGFLGGFRQAGIMLTAADIVAGLWIPNQSWTYAAGDTFASRGLVPGTYTVADILTGESITIQIGAVPEPTVLLLFGTGLAIAGVRRRMKN